MIWFWLSLWNTDDASHLIHGSEMLLTNDNLSSLESVIHLLPSTYTSQYLNRMLVTL